MRWEGVFGKQNLTDCLSLKLSHSTVFFDDLPTRRRSPGRRSPEKAEACRKSRIEFGRIVLLMRQPEFRLQPRSACIGRRPFVDAIIDKDSLFHPFRTRPTGSPGIEGVRKAL